MLIESGPSPLRLTERQAQCLRLVAAGKTSAEIARELGLSARTVEHYLTNACAKLGVRNRVQAVALGISLNLIPPFS